MLTILLRLFPASFRQTMGSEWLIDTRAEWAQARKNGAAASIRCITRTLAGSLQGAWTAHIHAHRRVPMPAAGPILVLSDHPPLSPRQGRLAGLAGAVLMGYVGGQIILSLLVESRGASIAAALTERNVWIAFMASVPVLVGVGVLVLGASLIFIAKNSQASATRRRHVILELGCLVVLCAVAQYAYWAVEGMSDRSAASFDALKDFEGVSTHMGLSHEDRPIRNLDPSGTVCTQAQAVFALASSRWLEDARRSGDIIPLLMLKSHASQLFLSGCWTEKQTLEYHTSLMRAAVLSPHQERKFKVQSLGIENGAHRQKLLRVLDISRAQWCTQLAVQHLPSETPIKTIQDVCDQIRQPAASVHTAGVYSPTEHELAAMMR